MSTRTTQWTVIAVYEHTGQIVAHHVQARSAMAAFARLAKNDPELSMVVALQGLQREGCELTFPGEGLVDGTTVLDQPDVFEVDCD